GPTLFPYPPLFRSGVRGSLARPPAAPPASITLVDFEAPLVEASRWAPPAPPCQNTSAPIARTPAATAAAPPTSTSLRKRFPAGFAPCGAWRGTVRFGPVPPATTPCGPVPSRTTPCGPVPPPWTTPCGPVPSGITPCGPVPSTIGCAPEPFACPGIACGPVPSPASADHHGRESPQGAGAAATRPGASPPSTTCGASRSSPD